MRETGCDVLIVGAGITGLAVARELVRRGVQDILILEKEPALGAHASGRNSGVLHAGIYYTPDTLKAKTCAEGNRLMKEFCREKGLTLKETGKVIVARSAAELPALHELQRRADAAGARAHLIDARQLAEIEPHARTWEKALHTPDTAVIKPGEILRALDEELLGSGTVRITTRAAFQGLEASRRAHTSAGLVRFEKFVNAAGAHADRIAHRFGLANEYRIVPFKGTYRKLAPDRTHLVRGNIYPVPDLRTPFLGVHFTRSADDEVYVGATAIPAFGRENYGGLRGVTGELFPILYRDLVLLMRNSAFRHTAVAECRRYWGPFFSQEARKLVPQLAPTDLLPSEKVGIRPQLVHWPTKRLEMDFVVVRDGDSLHILNAISPAFTTAIPFARLVVSALLGDRRAA